MRNYKGLDNKQLQILKTIYVLILKCNYNFDPKCVNIN